MSLDLHVKQIYDAALQAVQPATVLPQYIQGKNDSLIIDGKKYSLESNTKIFAVAIGKASIAMMNVVHEILNNNIAGSLVITKKAETTGIQNCTIIEADHPVPGGRSVAAAKALVKFLSDTQSDDIIIFLISGGASSLVTDVPDPLSLDDIKVTQKTLLLCGADINEINTVRKHLSGLKGGQLIRYCNNASVFSFIISDVAGNNVSVIGSGLTAADNSSASDAIHVIEKYKLLNKVPLTVIQFLKNKAEKEIDTDKALFKNVKNIIIADNKMALEQAAAKASSLGYHIADINEAMFGDTEAEAIDLVKQIRNYTGEKPACFIAGGETTIEVKGNGKGGRNQHFALTMLHELMKQNENENSFPVILAAGTDGTDGPTDAAGAFINSSLVKKIKRENISVEEYLSNNDSYNFFKRTESLFITGQTQTNVMDIVVVLVE
jgi:glycerate 2-kinase